MGWRRVLQGRIGQHRYWMLHMAAFGFTPITMRLLMMPTLYATDLSPQTVFGVTMLVAMVVNLAVLHGFILGTAWKPAESIQRGKDPMGVNQ